MNIKTHSIITVFAFMTFILISCSKDDNSDNRHYSSEDYLVLSESLNLPKVPFSYSVGIPQHLFFSSHVNRINVGEEDKATLGRVLFYDTKLSATNTVSCASCHQQEFAFADDKAVSDGVKNLKTVRNSLALAAAPNLSASYDGPTSASAFGWDHTNETSVDQSLAALLNNEEMGNTNIEEVAIRLNREPIYNILTKKAYNRKRLSGSEILESLDIFMNSISAFDTKFDEALKNSELFSAAGPSDFLTEQENIGKNIYMTNCATCHSTKQDIQRKQIANNGLDILYDDKGVGNIKGEEFNGYFKVPFLRNIALTAPYMHDGRFASLDEVIDHYSENIQPHKYLSFELRDITNISRSKKFNFSETDKQALKAFLHTLTDETVISEEKYSNPFNL